MPHELPFSQDAHIRNRSLLHPDIQRRRTDRLTPLMERKKATIMTSKDSGTPISRRRFLRVAAAGISGLGIGSLLAACGGTAAPAADAPAGAAPTAAAAAPAQGNTAVTEISFWWWSEDGKVWADEYAKVNPQIKVNFVNTPFADAHDKLLTSFAAGSGAPDVASIE